MTPDVSRDPVVAALRAGLEVWEREAAVQWDAVIRSPGVLRRMSEQLALTLDTQRRVAASLGDSAQRVARARQQRAQVLIRMEQLEAQIGALAKRLDRVERMLNGEQ